MENYLPVYEKVLYEKADKTLSTEVSLPEYLPNISKVVKVSVIPAASINEISEDSLAVHGRAVFGVVYVSDFRDKLKCAVFPCDFSHTFPVRGIKAELAEDGFAECSVQSSDEKASVLTPRRLALSCRLSVSAEATAPKKNEVFDPEENESLKKLTSDVGVLKISELPVAEVRIEENITLDAGMPQAQEIVFADCSLSVENARISDGVCTYTGSAAFNCMYLGDDDGEGAEYVSLSKSIPFTAQTNASGLDENAYVLCRTSLSGISADAISDSYGESKIISVSVGGSISSKAYATEKASVCEDVFCTVYPCECEVKELSYDSFAGSYCEKMTATESVHANLGNMTDIISQSAAVSVLSTEVVDSRLVINARAAVKLTGTNELGAIESASCSFGIKLPYSKSFDNSYEKCKFDTSVDVSGCKCRIENGEVRCELELCCSTAALARSHVRAVTAVQIDDSTELVKDKSEYIIYYPDSEDTLWSTAKKYRVSPTELMAINGMRSQSELPGKKTLVIPR